MRTIAVMSVTLLAVFAAELTPAQERRPFNAFLDDIVDVRISTSGLDFLAQLLADGLEQDELRTEAIAALEDQSFQILMPPPLGDYATITVDFGETSSAPHLDGFRYDVVDVELSTVPFASNVLPESGVLYPQLSLLQWTGADDPEKLPELYVRITHPLLGSTPVSAIAQGVIVTSGILRPFVGNGTVGFLVQNFETQVLEFRANLLDPDSNPLLTDEVEAAISEAIVSDFRKELEDALSDVLMSGLNDILFDRDQDGEADVLLDLNDAFTDLNESFGTDFDFAMEPQFQTNATLPTTVLLRVGGSMFLNTPGTCVGSDRDAGFPFTLLESDGIFGHDPPVIDEVAPNEATAAQFVISLSDDFLNQILYNAYRTGLGCVFVDPTAPGVPTDVAEVMTTDSLAIFLGGNWLVDAYGSVPVGFRLRFLEAPTAWFPPPEGEFELVLQMPAVQVDLMINDAGRWVRLMGAHARLNAEVGVDDLTLTGDRLASFTFSFAVTSAVNFNELVPERRSDLENLLPTAVSLLEGALGDSLESPAGDLTDCIEGLDVSLFDLAPFGLDPSGAFSHYLGLWLSFTGEVNLAEAFECLLGEPLVPAAPMASQVAVSPRPYATVPALGTRAHTAADLAGVPVRRWRFEPGLVHAGSDPVPALPVGVRRWSFETLDGSWRTLALVGGAVAPELRGERRGDELTVRTALLAGVQPPRATLHVYDAAGAVIAEVPAAPLNTLRAPDAARVVYSDAWGRSAVADVMAAGGFGCTAAPQASAAWEWAVWLLLLAGLRRRR